MKRMRWSLTTLAVCIVLLACSAAVQAVPRTFVSGSGSGANIVNNCSFTQPCRFLSEAYGITDLGGEIVALTTAGYGGLSITTPVTITAIPGEVGFISVISGSSGIVVNVGASNDVVIRNFQFSGSPAFGAMNTVGVTHTHGRLLLDGCTFTHLTTGVLVNDSTSRVNIRGSILQANTTGLYVTGGRVAVSDCLVSGNTTGIRADGDGGAQNNPASGNTMVRVERGDITHNLTGLHMHNPGMKPAVGPNNGTNIFLRHFNNGVATANIIDNPTPLLVTANAAQCGVDPCAFPNPGKYTSDVTIVQIYPRLIRATELTSLL